MSATKTITVDANLGEGFAIETTIDGTQLVIDQPKAAKGTGLGPSPLQYFLFSIGGCIGTVARIVAFQDKIAMQGMRICVEGDYNPAGLLGKETSDRVGFQQIRVRAEIDADLSTEEKAAFLDKVCHRCPIHDNISLTSEVVHSLV